MSHARELAFIDPTISDLDTFMAGLRPEVDAIVLSTEEDSGGSVVGVQTCVEHVATVLRRPVLHLGQQ